MAITGMAHQHNIELFCYYYYLNTRWLINKYMCWKTELIGLLDHMREMCGLSNKNWEKFCSFLEFQMPTKCGTKNHAIHICSIYIEII